MSRTGLQTINHQSKLALWRQQIAACRSSGQTVAQWCAAHEIPKSTYYTRQRRLYELTATAGDRFVEVPLESHPATEAGIATVSVGGITAEIHSGADEATMAALLRAMKSC